MAAISRRQFLVRGAKLAALMGLNSSLVPDVADALERFSNGDVPLLWLQGLSCSGCSVSFLNSESPGPAEILTRYISLGFHSTLSAATGDMAVDVVNRLIEQGEYYLVVEGSMPLGMPSACVFGGETVTSQVLRAAGNARAVMCAGACASFGGIPATEGNPTGAVSVSTFLQHKGITPPLINLPGCPAHPDWIIGTLVHVLKFGFPALDDAKRPLMFYSQLIHDQCPRFADYEREKFAATFSDEGCLFKLGCLGPVTHADCTLRMWNGNTNDCIKAHAPCIGCASTNFASRRSFPFYLQNDSPAEEKGA